MPLCGKAGISSLRKPKVGVVQSVFLESLSLVGESGRDVMLIEGP